MPKKQWPPETEKPAKKRTGPVSLYPLSFEEAVRGLLQVKMEPEPRKKTKV